MDDFWRIEDEPVAERRVQVSPDESTTGGTQPPPNAAGNSLGICRRCGQGTAYLIRFSKHTPGLPDTEVRCDRCFNLRDALAPKKDRGWKYGLKNRNR